MSSAMEEVREPGDQWSIRTACTWEKGEFFF